MCKESPKKRQRKTQSYIRKIKIKKHEDEKIHLTIFKTFCEIKKKTKGSCKEPNTVRKKKEL